MTWASSNKFARGHKRDVGHRRTPFKAMRDKPVSTEHRGISLRKFAPRVFDQSRAGSCGGHAYAAGANTAMASQGTPLPFVVSPRIWYALARLIDAPGQPLADVGSEPNALQRAGQEWGVCPMGPLVPEGYSDCNAANCNDLPNLGELVAAAQRLIIGEYALFDRDDYLNCLDAGIPFPLSVPGGSDAWQNYMGNAAIGPVPQDQSELDHEVLCIGYRVTHDGSIEFEILNSWGESYGDAGHIWINEAAMAQCADRTAMKVSLA